MRGIREMAVFTHKTSAGIEIPLAQLSNEHLRNIIARIELRSESGITVRHGGFGSGDDNDDVWYDCEVLYGDEALALLRHAEYVAEVNRRKEFLEGRHRGYIQ